MVEQPRRTFLRQLASLPLIGGSVALIGKPTAAAVPVTPDMLYAYTAFLAWEHAAAYWAYEAAAGPARPVGQLRHAPMFWFPEHRATERLVMGTPATTRAALVMSAAGLDWREG